MTYEVDSFKGWFAPLHPCYGIQRPNHVFGFYFLRTLEVQINHAKKTRDPYTHWNRAKPPILTCFHPIPCITCCTTHETPNKQDQEPPTKIMVETHEHEKCRW